MFLPSADPAASLKLALDDLRRVHLEGAGGRELARRRADLIDLALISLFRQAEHELGAGVRYREPGLAVVAVGGYGRRELCPFSDVDLMLLYRPEEAGRVQEVAEFLFYPLWDAGLELGHGARTVTECMEVAEESVELETSFLQTRLLVGDQELFLDFTDSLRARLAEDRGKAFVERLLVGRGERWERAGPAGALLEPELKEGKGGLRDVHELLWLAAALRGGAGLDGLAVTGWLDPAALVELEQAMDVLLAARASLHYLVGRKLDRVYLDYQEDLPGMMPPHLGGPPEAVMARVSSSAQTCAFRAEDAWQVVLREVVPGSAGPPVLPTNLPETSVGRRAFLTELLREGADGLPRLERLSHQGVLSTWLPGWEGIRSLGQRDSLHTYTVDGHSLRCVATAVDLAQKGGGSDALAAGLASELALTPRWEGLLLGCLLHDIGKGQAGDHSETGARLAAEAVAALGEPPEVQEQVAFLVRHHLLLPDVATRRDLDDPLLLARVAETIGSRERLQMLYVLSVADSAATGPAVWTPWAATLIQDLFFRLLAHVDGVEAAAGPLVVPAGAAPPATYTELQGLERTPGVTLVDLRLPEVGGGGEVAFAVRSTQLEGVEELSVVSLEHRGLLARVCGVLAVNGITIMGAQLQPGDDGLVTRTFHVADYFGGAVAPERWEEVLGDLGLALEGRLGLEHRLSEKAARYPTRVSAERHEQPRVVVENGASETLTVIEVHASDRIGLLYTIARAFDDLLLEVRLAKVQTMADRVVDVFYVADPRGRKLTDPGHLREVEREILFALSRS